MSKDWQTLSEYYSSQAWAKKRSERLVLDGFKCAKCGFTRALEVHHINYERFMHEDVSRDLITLCKKCHREIEKQKSLQDKTLTPLTNGAYHFIVKSHSIGHANSYKFPPNTPVVDCHLEIPYFENNTLKTTLVTNRLFVSQRTLFAIRQFTDCIGLTPEAGRVRVDLDNIDGRPGVCAMATTVSENGYSFNSITAFYAPSIRPLVILNDDAWIEFTALKED